MCCRYMLLGADAKELFAKAGVPGGDGAACPTDNHNIAPGSSIKVARAHPGHARRGRESALLHWGLRLDGAGARVAEAAGGPLVVNARAESLLLKAGFRGALPARRCLVPASGFFEWEKAGGKGRAGEARFPWLFQLREARPFFLAALWNPAPERNEQGACAIITTGASGVMRPVHHRMPVIVLPENADRWLGEDWVGALSLPPLEDGLLVARRVSRFVNNARNNGPECVAGPDATDAPEDRQGWLF